MLKHQNPNQKWQSKSLDIFDEFSNYTYTTSLINFEFFKLNEVCNI